MTTFKPATWIHRAYDIGISVRYVYGWKGNYEKGWQPTHGITFWVWDSPEAETVLQHELNADEGNLDTLAEYLIEVGLVIRYQKPEDPPAISAVRC